MVVDVYMCGGVFLFAGDCSHVLGSVLVCWGLFTADFGCFPVLKRVSQVLESVFCVLDCLLGAWECLMSSWECSMSVRECLMSA